MTLQIAIFLHKKGYTEDQTSQELIEWTDREYQAGRTKDDSAHAMSDIISTVKKVFRNNKSNRFNNPALIPSSNLFPLKTQRLNIFIKKSFKSKSNQASLAKTTAIILENFANTHFDGYFTLNNIPQICSKLNISKSTFYEHLKILEKSGFFFTVVQNVTEKEFHNSEAAIIKMTAEHAALVGYNLNNGDLRKSGERRKKLFYFPLLAIPKKDLNTLPKTNTVNDFQLLQSYSKKRVVEEKSAGNFKKYYHHLIDREHYFPEKEVDIQ